VFFVTDLCAVVAGSSVARCAENPDKMEATAAASPPTSEPRPLAPAAVAAAGGGEAGSDEEAADTPRTKAATRKWTDDEDALLQNAVKAHEGRNWKAISETLPDRSEVSYTNRMYRISTSRREDRRVGYARY